MTMFHAGNRALQDRMGSRPLADRIEQTLEHASFQKAEARFIGRQSFFFLATADADGRPDCSFKGGVPGFVRVVAPDLLVFPDYDGNGMFKSLGNIQANPNVGLLFLEFGEQPKRVRVNGRAELSFDDPLLAQFPGGQILVRVTPEHIFPNCPRYIPNMNLVSNSVYAPDGATTPPEPDWKQWPEYKDVVPPRKA
jgi:predicted pyridoxine 5'-phosphate oxidase superfamily flavin-nucleotide-binding protein